MERARADLYRRFHENENLNAHDISNFLKHVLERVDWKRDLHFQI